MTKAKAQEGPQEPQEGPQEPQTPPEAPEGQDASTEPQEGAQEPQEGTSTKAATFAEAADAQNTDQEYVLPVQRTSTDELADKGESKGLTFAEQAEKARELYGTGNPAVQDEPADTEK